MILYVGNRLSKYGFTPTSVETLGKFLTEKYQVMAVSDKKNKLSRMLDMIWTIIRWSKKIKIMLIDTYSTSNFYYSWCAGMLARLFGIPFIPILRGGDLPARLAKSPRMCRQLFGKAVVNVSPSQYLLQVTQDRGFDSVFIPNNIMISQYPFKQRSKLTPTLLWVRSFHETYNPKLAIEVVNLLNQNGIQSRLCMVGPNKDGSMDTVSNLIEQTDLQNQVTLTGKLDKADWIKLSKNYDIFINTTNFDNLPVSVLEAMALGFPVISTNVGGLPSLIDDGNEGILVQPENATAFVKSIVQLLKDHELSGRLSSQARQKALQFDWETIRHQWFALIDPYYD